jgi:hypothetical protein
LRGVTDAPPGFQSAALDGVPSAREGRGSNILGRKSP